MKASKVSFWISWGAMINLGICALLTTALQIGVDLGLLNSSFEIVGETIIIYALMLLVVAVIVSNKINIEIKRKSGSKKKAL